MKNFFCFHTNQTLFLEHGITWDFTILELIEMNYQMFLWNKRVTKVNQKRMTFCNFMPFFEWGSFVHFLYRGWVIVIVKFSASLQVQLSVCIFRTQYVHGFLCERVGERDMKKLSFWFWPGPPSQPLHWADQLSEFCSRTQDPSLATSQTWHQTTQ